MPFNVCAEIEKEWDYSGEHHVRWLIFPGCQCTEFISVPAWTLQVQDEWQEGNVACIIAASVILQSSPVGDLDLVTSYTNNLNVIGYCCTGVLANVCKQSIL